MTVTKADLVNRLAEATGWTKVDVEIVMNGFLANIMESLQEGDRVEIRGFGSFYNKERDPRKIKNPRTKQLMNIDHRFVPIFRPAKYFKKSVNEKMLMKQRMENDES
jgi:nucleoid DNA-binding protein